MDHVSVAGVGNVFLFVKDLDAAVAWYADLFGVQPERAMPQLAVFTFSPTHLTLHTEDEFDSAPAPGTGPVAYFDVVDVHAVAALVEAKGGRAHRGPKTVFSGETLLQVQDPQGNLIGFRQPPA